MRHASKSCGTTQLSWLHILQEPYFETHTTISQSETGTTLREQPSMDLRETFFDNRLYLSSESHILLCLDSRDAFHTTEDCRGSTDPSSSFLLLGSGIYEWARAGTSRSLWPGHAHWPPQKVHSATTTRGTTLCPPGHLQDKPCISMLSPVAISTCFRSCRDIFSLLI